MLSLILELAGGDLRKAITYLQTAQRLHSSIESPTPVSALSSTCFFVLQQQACTEQYDVKGQIKILKADLHIILLYLFV